MVVTCKKKGKTHLRIFVYRNEICSCQLSRLYLETNIICLVQRKVKRVDTKHMRIINEEVVYVYTVIVIVMITELPNVNHHNK